MVKRLVGAALAAVVTFALTGPAAAETKPKKEPSAAQVAARERMSKCSLEWKEAKAGGKVGKDMKWPAFWSACNKRLKDGTKA
ncbi:hypothetical protein FHR70_003675 [Microvirga lupini]|uniref:PsiF repeat-containing protein n=1 Tax=Microvirga lupini TaxID=420324 RepID=A0A7W4VNS8_9HYPH|nr:hypothetical protein [Microvirga lupini]MBB3020589.1 hypothetical protein [Microvirga lupini]